MARISCQLQFVRRGVALSATLAAGLALGWPVAPDAQTPIRRPAPRRPGARRQRRPGPARRRRRHRRSHHAPSATSATATAATVLDVTGTLRHAGVHRRPLSRRARDWRPPELKHGRPVLAQGITTVLVNPDGGGPVDLGGAARRLRARRPRPERRPAWCPHGSVRREVLGMSDRDPTPAELARMVGLVRDGMRAGAFGLSSGLYYAPGSYSKTAEVVAMARAAAAGGGSYTSHIRDEADYGVGVVAAVDEVIAIAETGRPHRRRHPHEGARPGELGPVEDAGRAHRGGARRAASRCSPTSIPTRPAAPASSAR